MPITFKSEEERKKHKIAGAIPKKVWNNSLIFCKEIEQWVVDLVNPDYKKTVTALTAMVASTKDWEQREAVATDAAAFATRAQKKASKAILLSKEAATTNSNSAESAEKALATASAATRAKKEAAAAKIAAKKAKAIVDKTPTLALYHILPVWFAIAFNNPSFTAKELSKLATILKFDKKEYVQLAGKLGHWEFFCRVEKYFIPSRVQEKDYPFDYDMLSLAAEHGHLKIIQHLKKMLHTKPTNLKIASTKSTWEHYVCKWDFNVVLAAAANGHLKILKELAPTFKAHTKSWNPLFAVTALRGHTEVLKYLVSLKPKIPNWSEVYKLAAENNHVETVVYLMGLIPPQPAPAPVRPMTAATTLRPTTALNTSASAQALVQRKFLDKRIKPVLVKKKEDDSADECTVNFHNVGESGKRLV